MSDIRRLLEKMAQFAGEPEQRPGDQVRGTEPAKKKKSGKHPFQGRLVGGGTESILRDLETQLVEGELERRLREEFDQLDEKWTEKYKRSINCSHPRGFSQRAHCQGRKKHNESIEMESVCPDCGMCETHGDNLVEITQRLDAHCWKNKHKEGTKIKGGVRVNNCVPNESLEEFAPPGDDGGGDGFDDETLKRLAAQWWQGDEDPRVEQTLQAAGWEIGQDEGYDNGGVFVVQAGDINGNSYMSWPAEELEGLDEARLHLTDPNTRVNVYYQPPRLSAEGRVQNLAHNIPYSTLEYLIDKLKTKYPQMNTEYVIWKPVGGNEYGQHIEEQDVEETVATAMAPAAGTATTPAAGTATATAQPGQAQPIDPKNAAALKQSLMKLKTSVPGLDVTKAVTTMAKADTGTQLNPADQKIASAIAPQLANVMKNPQMATSLKMMIDKANQQEKAAAAKPPGTV